MVEASTPPEGQPYTTSNKSSHAALPTPSVTIVSGIIMVLLFFSELRLYTNQEPLHQLAVDQSRSDGMIVYIDIALHDVKCSGTAATRDQSAMSCGLHR